MQLEIAFTSKHRFLMKIALLLCLLFFVLCVLAGISLLIYMSALNKPSIMLVGIGIFLSGLILPNFFWLIASFKRYIQNPPFLAFTKQAVIIRGFAYAEPEYLKWRHIDYIKSDENKIVLHSNFINKVKSKDAVILKGFYQGQLSYLENKSSMQIEQLISLLNAFHKTQTDRNFVSIEND